MLRRVHPAIRIVATEVIAGEWGDGQERIQALRDRGFNPKVVQAEVNRQLEKANEEYVKRKVWRDVK